MKRLILTLLTALLTGSDVPTKVTPQHTYAVVSGNTPTGARKQFWPDALPPTTSDSYGN